MPTINQQHAKGVSGYLGSVSGNNNKIGSNEESQGSTHVSMPGDNKFGANTTVVDHSNQKKILSTNTENSTSQILDKLKSNLIFPINY